LFLSKNSGALAWHSKFTASSALIQMEAQGKGGVVKSGGAAWSCRDLDLLNASTEVLVGNGKVLMFWIASWINNTSVVVMPILFYFIFTLALFSPLLIYLQIQAEVLLAIFEKKKH